MSDIIKVALTGGPCSGKTTCMEKIKNYYEQRGVKVLVCPESATQMITAGVSRDDMLAFETAVAKNQLDNESDIDTALACCTDDKVVVLYDRGLTDCFGYVDDEIALAQAICVDRITSWSRYDAVLFFEASRDYVNDSVRIESLQEAEKYSKKILHAWVGHPHLRYIKCAKNIDEKTIGACEEINCLLSNTEREKKYLIEYPNLDDFAKYEPFKTEIEQVYLLSDFGTHRIRKRCADGICTYFETLKIRITGSMCTEIENIISYDEYNLLMKKANPKKVPIVKDRYCFLYKGQYFEMDVFAFWNDKALVELEIKDENQIVELPPEIKVIADVSEDKKYKNNYLAGKLYEDSKA